MEQTANIIEAIKNRKSVRNYSDAKISGEIMEKIERFLSSDYTYPFGTQPGFELIDATDTGKAELKRLGTYGIIRGAKYFIAGIVKAGKGTAPGKKALPEEQYLIDFGYAFERLILFLTGLGLGTCWLGGSFNRAGFTSKIQPEQEGVLAAVSPTGYKNERKSVMDFLIRNVAGSKYRKSWEALFFDNTFNKPLKPAEAGWYMEPLEMVRLAPSASNKQPWRIIRQKGGTGGEENGQDNEGTHFNFFLERTKFYPGNAANPDLQIIDMGIAMCHFEQSCIELGIKGGWEKGRGKGAAGIGKDYGPNDAPLFIASWCEY